ncbi:MAG TPA: 2Fe-2S iron-sulfur cluster binding domain-containing protein [Phycisphaeraceae bacterium]|nr:2Fe-2S iron-sulfur cluster binding domain-containing protein [Phycisphaeraceae bacterium]
MSDQVTLTIDGKEIQGRPGQSILEAAQEAGIYIPRLCYREGLTPHGSCRLCTVMVNGRPMSACTSPVAPGMVVENDTDRINAMRRDLIDMLFVEGNHFCMFCEKSGNCELQAMAYRFGITAPRFPYLFPKREVDATHPEIFIDRNRCILCGRCVRASREIDGKNVFEFVGRGPKKRVAVNSDDGLVKTDVAATDEAISACPVGALLRKHVGYKVPLGQRTYDFKPIGADVEAGETNSVS